MSDRGIVFKDKSKTVQARADECRMSHILKKYQRTGTVSHLNRYQPRYGDFADFNYEEAMNKIAQANSMFAELPSEVRREFGNDPSAFLAFVNDPAHAGKLAQLLPALAEPGTQFPDVVGGGAAEAPQEAAQAASTPSEGAPSSAPSGASEAPSGADSTS